MRFKILVILVILVFCVYDFAYSHSGRTNSAGCHNVRATGGYHCHSSSGSSGSGSYSQSEDDVYLVLGLVVVVVGIGYWAYTTNWGKNPQGCGCFLPRRLDNQPLTRGIFDETPMRFPVRGFKLPELHLGRQGMSGWQLDAAYTFRF